MEKWAAIEIQLVNTSGKFTFPNDNFLNGKTITGIWLADNPNDDMVSDSGRPYLPDAAVNASSMTLRVNGSDAVVLTAPLKFYQQNAGDRRMRDVEIKDYNPGTSYLNIQRDPATGNALYTTDQSAVIYLRYLDC